MIPSVTIGIPCYNAAGTIQAAIDSAVRQSWGSHEVIVVDDGSTDNTALLAATFGDSIKLIRTGNRGANHARNLILKEAHGEWIQFLDDDDVLERKKIEQQFREGGDLSDVDVIYSPVWIETQSRSTHVRMESETSPDKDIYSQWLAWHLPQTGGPLWRRGSLLDIGGWKDDQLCCQEYETYLRSLRERHKWRFTPTPGAVYRINAGETAGRQDPELVIRVKTTMMDQLLRWMETQGLVKAEHLKVAGKTCFEMARTLARLNRKEAVQYHNNRRQRGLLNLEGPAATPAYRAIYHLLGFRAAEAFAPARSVNGLMQPARVHSPGS